MGREWGRETEAELKERCTHELKLGEHEHHRNAFMRPGTPWGIRKAPNPTQGGAQVQNALLKLGGAGRGSLRWPRQLGGDQCCCSIPATVRQVSPGRMESMTMAPTDLRFSPH